MMRRWTILTCALLSCAQCGDDQVTSEYKYEVLRTLYEYKRDALNEPDRYLPAAEIAERADLSNIEETEWVCKWLAAQHYLHHRQEVPPRFSIRDDEGINHYLELAERKAARRSEVWFRGVSILGALAGVVLGWWLGRKDKVLACPGTGEGHESPDPLDRDLDVPATDDASAGSDGATQANG